MEKGINHQFLEVYQPIHEPFTRYCSTKAFGIRSTEDLVQEAILIALSNFEKITDQKNILGYLIGIVNNIIHNQKRRQKFDGAWDEAQLQFIEANVSDPVLAMDIQYLYQCIQRLPRPQQEALILREISGCGFEEIADLQDTSIGAVKTKIHRARKRLKHLYEATPAHSKLSDSLLAFTSILL